MKTKILITAILLLVNIYSTISQTEAISGDFGLGGTVGTNLKIRISSYSIPFEGITNPKTNFIPFNRINNIQNGVNYRFFESSSAFDSSNIALLFFEGIVGASGIVFDLGHVSGAEFPDAGINNAYGFCKYLIEFEIPLTGEKYSLFYNTLDSKFGGKFPNGEDYFIGDIYVKYLDTLPLNNRLKVYKEVRSGPNAGFSDIDTISTSDTLPNGLPSKEIKVWDIYFGNNSSPYEKKFYARSTPFPISQSSAQDTNMRRELIIGTKVVFDTVFRNNDDVLSGLDKWGYNTQNNPYYSFPDIPFNKPGRTYLTPGTFREYFNNWLFGIKVIAEENDTMIFNYSIRFWIIGEVNPFTNNFEGDTLVLKQGSTLILGETAEIFTHNGGVLIDEGANRVWGNESCHRAFPNTAINFTGESHTVNNGGFIVIDGEANLNLGDNTTLTFDGYNSFLKLSPNSKVNLGTNSKIEFKNGAYLIADSCDLEGNNGASWVGLVFHNAGGETQIKNCTFNDAKISIDIKNTTGCYANLEKKIIGNTFHQITSSSQIIRADNIFKLLLQGNIFNIAAGKVGVEIKNTLNAGIPMVEEPSGEGEGGESASPPCISTSYALNLLGNTFNNGGMQLYLNCWAAAVTPFMIQGNGFYNTSGLTSISIAGRKVSGDFKQNNFASSGNSIGTNVILLQSSVNMFNNLLQNANLQNLWASTQSSFKMAPVYQNGQWIWLGGYNNLSSTKDNILVTYGSTLPTLDFGKNCFSIPTQGQDKYHISGFDIPWNVAQHQTYYIRENSWNGWMGSNIPVLNITNHQNQHIPYLHTPTITCPSTSWDGYTTQDIGFGIYDTVYYNNIGDLPDFEEDQELYNQAIYGYYDGDYLTSITTFKTLIQGHPESGYTESCLYDLYDNYRALDTSSEQSYVDNLYSDLKNFLSAIILAESHSEEFNFVAYEIIQMCEVNMHKYNDALTGYEFIAMYHPDPEARFLASADHQEIMDMLGEGQGGMNLSAEENFKRLEKKLNSLIKSDPVSQKLSRQFETQLNEKVINKTSTDSKELSSREVRDMSRNEKEEKVYNRSQKDLINKSNTLLLSGRSMTKEERRNIVSEGIFLIAGMKSGDEISENTLAPSSYSLNQNYPNPFNPETNISFSVPVEGLVKLKVFDITGREVAVLVNEIRTPGSYNVLFNGATLSSGVYFYRIEAGSFVETKRMLMLK